MGLTSDEYLENITRTPETWTQVRYHRAPGSAALQWNVLLELMSPSPVSCQHYLALPFEFSLCSTQSHSLEHAHQASLDQQTFLDMVSPCGFQVIRTGKVTNLILPKKKGWEEEIERKKKNYINKIVQFVGRVLRMKYFLLIPSGALHPRFPKQARYAAGMIFARSDILGRAAV